MSDLFFFYWFCDAKICIFLPFLLLLVRHCVVVFSSRRHFGTTPHGSSSSTPLLDYDCFWLRRPCAKDGDFLLVATFALYSMFICTHCICTPSPPSSPYVCGARQAWFSLVFSPLSFYLLFFISSSYCYSIFLLVVVAVFFSFFFFWCVASNGRTGCIRFSLPRSPPYRDPLRPHLSDEPTDGRPDFGFVLFSFFLCLCPLFLFSPLSSGRALTDARRPR